MFDYQMNGERAYLSTLNALGSDTISGWRGAEVVSMEVYCKPLPHLVAEFRYLRKTNSCWETFVHNERRFRSKHGFSIPYQCVSTFCVRGRHMERVSGL